MDMREVRELTQYWRKHPPACESMANLVTYFYGSSKSGARGNTASMPHSSSSGEVMRPTTMEEMQNIPIPMAPTLRQAPKLIRLPIRIPGDTDYVDRTPAGLRSAPPGMPTFPPPPPPSQLHG